MCRRCLSRSKYLENSLYRIKLLKVKLHQIVTRASQKELGEMYTLLSAFRDAVNESEWRELYRTGLLPARFSNDKIHRIPVGQFDKFTAKDYDFLSDFT